nr:hypothetical protein [Mesorhizobium qingshengii]
MIGRDHRRTKKHRLDQGPSKRLSNGGNDENVCGRQERLDRAAKAHEADRSTEPALGATCHGGGFEILRASRRNPEHATDNRDLRILARETFNDVYEEKGALSLDQAADEAQDSCARLEAKLVQERGLGGGPVRNCRWVIEGAVDDAQSSIQGSDRMFRPRKSGHCHHTIRDQRPKNIGALRIGIAAMMPNQPCARQPCGDAPVDMRSAIVGMNDVEPLLPDETEHAGERGGQVVCDVA